MDKSSYSESIRSSSIMGGAQIVNILASVIKMKFVAVLLGPTGVGIVGLYQTLVQTAASISSLGLATAGIRQVAAAGEDEDRRVLLRLCRSISWAGLLLAGLGGLMFWLSSGLIAKAFLSDDVRSADVAWLSLGVVFTVAAGSQSAVLTGLRRLSELAKISMASGVAAAVFGVLAVWLLPQQGPMLLVVAGPALAFLFSRFYVARLARTHLASSPGVARPNVREMAAHWNELTRLGVVFMAGSFALLLGQLAIRAIVQRQLGSDALGQFQAAWSIGMIYLGFVLTAMGTDYYPRLAAVINDRRAAVRLVNEQTEVALLLCTPAILAMLAFAPWIVRLLYSSAFDPAVEILRWQLLGDILKVIIWPLAFLQQASGAARTFFITELFGNGVLVLAVLVGLPQLGLTATGVAFLVSYALYLPVIWWLGRRWIAFRWTRAVKLQIAAVVFAAALVASASHWSAPVAAVGGGFLSLLSALWALIRLAEVAGTGGRLTRLGAVGTRVRQALNCALRRLGR